MIMEEKEEYYSTNNVAGIIKGIAIFLAMLGVIGSIILGGKIDDLIVVIVGIFSSILSAYIGSWEIIVPSSISSSYLCSSISIWSFDFFIFSFVEREQSKKIEAGYVISQDVPENAEIVAGSTVTITVSTGIETSLVRFLLQILWLFFHLLSIQYLFLIMILGLD